MYTKKLLTLSLTLLLVVAMALPVFAQDNSPAATQEAQATVQPALTASTDFFLSSNTRVNVRSGPGLEYTVISKLNRGDSLDITGKNNEAGEWLRVNFNGQEGWVFADVVEVTGDVATAQVFEPGPNATLRGQAVQGGQTTQGDQIATGVTVVTRFNTNLRGAASLSGERLTVIPFNTELPVLARTENNNWVQVQYNDMTGWVSAGLLSFMQGNINTLTIVNADGTITTGTTGDASQNQSGTTDDQTQSGTGSQTGTTGGNS